MDKLFLISSIPLSVNHYLGTKVIYNPKLRKQMPIVYETPEAKKYKQDFARYIKKEVVLQNWKMDETGLQHFYVDCDFYFDRIDKDCNNYFKLLLDAITESEMVWKDDNIVCERVNRILYDSENPRIELTIYPVDYIGIFKNYFEYNVFISNQCKNCKSYKRNCSILKKAKEGRIQKEINCLSCEKYIQNKIN